MLVVQVGNAAVTYQVQVLVVAGAEEAAAAFRATLIERLDAFGLRNVVRIQFVGEEAPADTTSLVMYFGAVDRPERLADAVTAAQLHSRVVLPVVVDAASTRDQLPPSLHVIKAHRWSPERSPQLVAGAALSELGIEERQRRVFISYAYRDAFGMAGQIHNALQQRGFDPFLDRLRTPLGTHLDDLFEESLNDFAFVLVLESPTAHQAEGLLKEVQYALSHYLGPLIVSWPGAKEIPETIGLRRFGLSEHDLQQGREYARLTDDALDRLLADVERSHAAALMRRRRALVESAQEALRAKGRSFVNLPGWRLLAGDLLIGFSTLLPTPDDLFELDSEGREIEAVQRVSLVHATRRLSPRRQSLLEWSIAGRPLQLVPETSVGHDL